MSKKYDVYSGGSKIGEIHEQHDVGMEVAQDITTGGLIALPFIVIAVLCCLFLPLYCTYRIAQPSTSIGKILLHVVGVYVGIAVWGIVLYRSPDPTVGHMFFAAFAVLVVIGLVLHIARAAAD